MTAAFFLMLREGLEAALIVESSPRTWSRSAGVRPGKVSSVSLRPSTLSVGAGILVVTTVGRLPLVVQETLEGVAALAAVAVLTWMLFWMRRQGRGHEGRAGTRCRPGAGRRIDDRARGPGVLAVVREGLETVLFLFAIWSSSGDVAGLMLASLAGLAGAIGIGYAIFAMGIRIDLRKFFTITGVVLIFVSAGLVSFAIAEFTEAGILP